MSYVAKVLVNGESVIYSGKLHPVFFVVPCVLAMLPILFAESNPLFLFFVPIILLSIHPYWTTEIALTDRRLIFKRGLISRHVQEILLSKIEGIDVNQSLLGRMLNYGGISVRGVGIGEIILPKDLDDPFALKKVLDESRTA